MWEVTLPNIKAYNIAVIYQDSWQKKKHMDGLEKRTPKETHVNMSNWFSPKGVKISTNGAGALEHD